MEHCGIIFSEISQSKIFEAKKKAILIKIGLKLLIFIRTADFLYFGQILLNFD